MKIYYLIGLAVAGILYIKLKKPNETITYIPAPVKPVPYKVGDVWTGTPTPGSKYINGLNEYTE